MPAGICDRKLYQVIFSVYLFDQEDYHFESSSKHENIPIQSSKHEKIENYMKDEVTNTLQSMSSKKYVAYDPKY
jgi:hypothetical protein